MTRNSTPEVEGAPEAIPDCFLVPIEFLVRTRMLPVGREVKTAIPVKWEAGLPAHSFDMSWSASYNRRAARLR